MDHNDREQFWKTLCSLPGNDIVAEREQLFKSIKYPKLLFRYRPVSTKSLEALRTNKLYFSSANYYDDPFDTFLHIDIEAIRKEYLNIGQELTSAIQAGAPLLNIGIGYFDYRNKISPAKADGGFSYIIKANRDGIIHI